MCSIIDCIQGGHGSTLANRVRQPITKQVRQLPLGRRHPPQTKLNKLGKNLDLQHFPHVRFVLSAPVPLTLNNKSHPGKRHWVFLGPPCGN